MTIGESASPIYRGGIRKQSKLVDMSDSDYEYDVHEARRQSEAEWGEEELSRERAVVRSEAERHLGLTVGILESWAAEVRIDHFLTATRGVEADIRSAISSCMFAETRAERHFSNWDGGGAAKLQSILAWVTGEFRSVLQSVLLERAWPPIARQLRAESPDVLAARARADAEEWFREFAIALAGCRVEGRSARALFVGPGGFYRCKQMWGGIRDARTKRKWENKLQEVIEIIV